MTLCQILIAMLLMTILSTYQTYDFELPKGTYVPLIFGLIVANLYLLIYHKITMFIVFELIILSL